MTPENFDRLLRPRHIAFIGGRDAAIAIAEARRRRFEGEIWAVNPKRDTLAGVPCVASIADLPQAPDAAYLAIPAGGVVDAIGTLADMGTGGVVCFSAGFKETGDSDAEAALIDAAGDMAVIGPNCYGMINYIDNTALWSFEHGGWSPGYGAAIITQSGMFSSDITMSQRSLPMAYMVSAGNQAVLGLEDFLEHFATDPAVRAIGLHIEGLRDLAKFERAALTAIENGKAVVALKTGSSQIGATLTISHTGSLSGANELYEALFARTGVIGVTNPSQFVETLKYFCTVTPKPGDRLGGFTCSGGGATMMADYAERIGLTLPTVAPDQKDALADLLPDIATVSNPLDYTTPIWGQPERTHPVFKQAIVAMTPDAALLLQDYPLPGLDDSIEYYRIDAEAFGRAAKENGVPAAICSTLPENMDEGTRQLLIEHGVAPMQGLHEAMNAIKSGGDWAGARACLSVESPEPLVTPVAYGPTETKTEDTAKAWLAQQGFPVPAGLSCTADEMPDHAGALTYPVALKMMSEALPHKTEAGAVALGIRDEAALLAAVAKMKSDVTAFDPKAVTDRFLVEPMAAPPLAELLLTLRRDLQFGAALVLGSGGILVELVGDAVTLLLPATPADIAAALRGLRVSRLLDGFRGRAAADIDQIAATIHSLCEAFLDATPTMGEIEINPLFVTPGGVIAIDALVQVESDKGRL